MKKSELRSLIKEEIKKIFEENENFGSDIEKQIRAERTAQQQEFISWAKQEADKRKIGRISFQGRYLILAALSKLNSKGILTQKLINTWKAAPEGSKENNLYQGLSVIINRHNLTNAPVV